MLTADLHVMPHDWIEHRINSIRGQKVIRSGQLIEPWDIKWSQFPAKHAKTGLLQRILYNLLVLWRTLLAYEGKKAALKREQDQQLSLPHPCGKMTARQSKPGQCKDPEQIILFSQCTSLPSLFFFSIYMNFLPLFNKPFVCSFFLLFVCLLPEAEVGQGGVEERCACLCFFFVFVNVQLPL